MALRIREKDFHHIFCSQSIVKYSNENKYHSFIFPQKVSKEVIFSVMWQPNTEDCFITYGKNHMAFWKVTIEGTTMLLARRNGIFDVSEE